MIEAKDSEKLRIHKPIKIKFDGVLINGEAMKTSPYDLVSRVSKNLAEKIIIAKVDNKLWGLDRPLERDCSLSVFQNDDEEAHKIFGKMDWGF